MAFGYDQAADDAQFEASAAYDYKVEAYGDRCPGCGTLRWGGDCPRCMDDDYRSAEEVAHDDAVLAAQALVPAAPVVAYDPADDDIPF